MFGGAAGALDNLLVSVATDGTQADRISDWARVSSNGRFVVFASRACNLVANDSNESFDVFRRDLLTKTTELVSVSIRGTSGSMLSIRPDVSHDGRFVVWDSLASDLVLNDTNGKWDVFVRDMALGTTHRLSVRADGSELDVNSHSARITPSGRHVAFMTGAVLVPRDRHRGYDCYVLDRFTGEFELASTRPPPYPLERACYYGGGRDPCLSDNGRRVAFISSGSDHVPGDTNHYDDVFWKDLDTGELRRVSVSSSGAQANTPSLYQSMSGDGLTVAFCSDASTLVDGDTNDAFDVFAHDVLSAETTRLSVLPNGDEARGNSRTKSAVSLDGRFVIFSSSAQLVFDNTTTDYDIFLRDRSTGTTTQVNFGFDVPAANGPSQAPHMTPDLRTIVFKSAATNLVPGDRNRERDIFATHLPFVQEQ